MSAYMIGLYVIWACMLILAGIAAYKNDDDGARMYLGLSWIVLIVIGGINALKAIILEAAKGLAK